MDVGEYVIDADDEDPDLAVVVQRPDATVSDITVGSGEEQRTVADDNPDYPADEPAVKIAFVESGLTRHWEEWTTAESDELYAGAQSHGVKLYTFPESRLSTVPDEEATVMLSETTVNMDGLRARLEDANWNIESRDDGSIVVEKMGQQYRIHPTGTVEGDGQIREPLENIVEQYMG